MTRIDSRWFHVAAAVAVLVLTFQVFSWLGARAEADRAACLADWSCWQGRVMERLPSY